MVNQALHDYYVSKQDIVDLSRLEKSIEHLGEFLGNYQLPEIDIPICRQYKAHRKQQLVKRYDSLQEVSDATIARELGVLKAAANHAAKWKKITADKMPTFELPKELPKNEIWLFEDELQQLFDAAKGDKIMNMYLCLLYVTASRRAAIERLEWSQLDFNRKVIHLNKPGQKETKKRRPVVPMGKIHEMLSTEMITAETKWVLGKPADRYVAFRSLLEKANLLEVEERDGRPAGRVSPHVMRHTRATHLLEKGMSIYAVAQLLGDNPTTVERVYAHACTSKLNEELEKYG